MSSKANWPKSELTRKRVGAKFLPWPRSTTTSSPPGATGSEPCANAAEWCRRADSCSGQRDRRSPRPSAAPEQLSDEERALWEKLTFSRRPGWFAGAELLLESYVTTTLHCQRLEAALRKAKLGTSDRYQKLARMHRQAVALAATLATRLRLTPHAKLDKRTPTDGDMPVA